MTVIAIEGRAGSGVVDVTRVVARELDLDFVDRLLLAEIARRVGATYAEMNDSLMSSGQELDERHFIQTTAEVIRDVAQADNAVIVNRGAVAILRDNPNVLRVGLVANRSDRARRIISRLHFKDMEIAEQYVSQSDTAQARYFERAFGTNPLDPFLYHVMWNLSEVSDDWAAARIIDASGALTGRELR